MISVDRLEVLLRTVPQYFLFAALALFIFGWMDKKTKLNLIAEILLIIVGVMSFFVMISGMIPSPTAPGIDEEHIRKVIKMLFLFVIDGSLAAISLGIQLYRKKAWNPLVVTIVAIAIVIFFQSTSLSKIKFEFNVVQTEILTDSIQ